MRQSLGFWLFRPHLCVRANALETAIWNAFLCAYFRIFEALVWQ